MSWFNRLSGRNQVAVSSSSQTIGNLLVALISVGVLRITTHQLGPEGYGLFALVITYVSLFTLVTDLGITAMTTRELARQGADQASILSVAMSSRVALSIATIPVIIASALIVYPGHSALFELAIAVMSVDVLFKSIHAVGGTVFTVRIRGDVVASLLLINRMLYLGGVIVVAILHGTYFAYICAYVGADLIIALTYLVLIRRLVALRWSTDLGAWRIALVASIPLGFIQVIDNVYSWVDSVMLSLLRSNVELGLYIVAFNVVNMLSTISSFLMLALMPSLVNADRAEIERLVNRAVYVLTCVGAPLAVGAIVLNHEIVLLLAGPKFLAAATPLAILAVSLPITFVQTAIGITCLAVDRFRPLVAVGLVVLGVNVLVNLAMIPWLGPSGAAVTLVCTEFVSLIGTSIVFSRLTGIRADFVGLWRPILAACCVLGLVALRQPVLAHLGTIGALIIGGALVGVLYGAALFVLRGLPEEVPTPRFLHAGRQRRR